MSSSSSSRPPHLSRLHDVDTGINLHPIHGLDSAPLMSVSAAVEYAVKHDAQVAQLFASSSSQSVSWKEMEESAYLHANEKIKETEKAAAASGMIDGGGGAAAAAAAAAVQEERGEEHVCCVCA